MILIVGLGNPGDRYANTRHNAGFLAVDRARRAWQSRYKMTEWKISTRFSAALARGIKDEDKIMLAKPLTFMNNSGKSVRAIAHYYKIVPSAIWIVHDELDLPLGSIRVSTSASAAGHKGVQSIIDEMTTNDFSRLRIGIAPTQPSSRPTDVEQFVLKAFSSDEQTIMDEHILPLVVESLQAALIGSVRGSKHPAPRKG